ncbi:hypothetical protein CCYA_CCYA06G1942 [Cyanidiococcus yangmingshanensis]|nr:hypothetical protein CCYA_CCYA06G1942 [Cyanidiococcus yangmingshanensis]
MRRSNKSSSRLDEFGQKCVSQSDGCSRDRQQRCRHGEARENATGFVGALLPVRPASKDTSMKRTIACDQEGKFSLVRRMMLRPRTGKKAQSTMAVRTRSQRSSRATVLKSDETSNELKEDLDKEQLYEPKVGDIVLFPGKWPGEHRVGVVENVTSRETAARSIVDIQPLQRLGQTSTYVEGAKRKAVWMESGDVISCNGAEYDEKNKVWHLPALPSLMADDQNRQLSLVERNQGLQEYERLKRWLIQGTVATSALGTAYYAVRNGVVETIAFAAGSLAGVLYLTLLQRSVDRIRPAALSPEQPIATTASDEDGERQHIAPVFPVARYALPFLLILGLFVVQKGSLTPREVFACILGFLTYKIPLWYASIREFVDSARQRLDDPDTSAAASVERSGSSEALLKRQVRFARNLPDLSRVPPPVEAIVVTGPSGVGKSTLIARLLAEFPNHLGYSVSTTTRAPRSGEIDGISYHFVSKEKFLADVEAGKFIEYASVYGNYYGTTFDAVRAVTQASPPRICLLSLDLQGVDTMMSSQSLDAFFIWIAPPSLHELERRLRERETESPTELARRLAAARQEMERADRSPNFDIRIVNDDFEVAYGKLRRVVLALLHGQR